MLALEGKIYLYYLLLLIIYNNNNISFITDGWSMLQTQSNNARAQKMVSHNGLQSRCVHAANTDRRKAL